MFANFYMSLLLLLGIVVSNINMQTFFVIFTLTCNFIKFIFNIPDILHTCVLKSEIVDNRTVTWDVCVLRFNWFEQPYSKWRSFCGKGFFGQCSFLLFSRTLATYYVAWLFWIMMRQIFVWMLRYSNANISVQIYILLCSNIQIVIWIFNRIFEY